MIRHAIGYYRYGLEAEPQAASTSEPEDDAAEPGGQRGRATGGKRHLSTKERALLKKGIKPGSEAVTKGQQRPAGAPEAAGSSGNGAGGEQRNADQRFESLAQQQSHQRPKSSGPATKQASDPGNHQPRPGSAKQPANGAQGKGGKGGAQAQPSVPEAKRLSAPRGKSGKLRKLQEKYVDQDEEDRLLALQLLGSTGKWREGIPVVVTFFSGSICTSETLLLCPKHGMHFRFLISTHDYCSTSLSCGCKRIASFVP